MVYPLNEQTETSFNSSAQNNYENLTLFQIFTQANEFQLICNSLGPVVQSVVSLMSSLRVISLTVLADSIYNILMFFAEKNVSSFCTAKATHIFSAKNCSIFAYHSI